MYKCPNCGYVVEKLPKDVKCPHCAYRILVKQRVKIVRVKAI
jgi:DNA-directed RNA polymerase subunit RPC12/RpoP